MASMSLDFSSTSPRHLTQQITTFCSKNYSISAYVVFHWCGVKAFFPIENSMSFTTIRVQAVRNLHAEYPKDQFLVHCYFCCLLMICQDFPMFYFPIRGWFNLFLSGKCPESLIEQMNNEMIKNIDGLNINKLPLNLKRPNSLYSGNGGEIFTSTMTSL